MNRTTRRVIAALSGLTLATTLAACGNPTDATSGGEQTVNLILSNNPWQRAIEPLIDDFESESGIKVNVQTFAEQQARDKILLNQQSKSTEMDVFMTLPSREGPQFAQAGYYEPLDDYLAEAPEEYAADDFFPGAMEGMKSPDGKIIALPIDIQGPVLYYRKDVFADLGIQPPTTIEETIEAADKIKSEGDGITPITLRGASAALPFTFGPFLHGEGVAWTNEAGEPNFDQPGAVKAIDQYATLARDYGPKGVINYSFTESSTLFAQGKAAMELESSNELNSLIDEDNSTVGDQVGVVKMPAGSATAAPTALSWSLAMSPFAANKEPAWEFLQWASSPETQLKLTEEDIAPPRDSVAADPAYTDTLDTDAKKEWGEALADIQQNGNTEVGPVGVKAPAMREVVGDAVGKVILGEIDAQAAADEIQQGLTPLLKE